MSIKIKSPGFEGQTFYVGIDVHKANWKVTLRNSNIELKTFSMDPSPEQLAKHMKRNYPNGTYNSVYEAGFCGYWIHRELQKHGFHNIIVHPCDIPSKNKERENKSDAVDSRKLAREYNNGSLNGIYVPDESMEAIRCMNRLLRQYTSRVTQIKNRIKGYLHFSGIKIPEEYSNRRCWSKNFINHLSSIRFNTTIHELVLSEHIDELLHIRSKKLKLLKQISAVSKEIPIISLLKTVPGIGPLTAFALYAELVDINRFKNLDTLAKYVGLVPSVQSSDKKITVKGITSRHCKYLRASMIESAWVAVRNDGALLDKYNQLLLRMKGQDAIVRIAKKLLNRIRFVWKTGSPYEKGVVEVLTT